MRVMRWLVTVKRCPDHGGWTTIALKPPHHPHYKVRSYHPLFAIQCIDSKLLGQLAASLASLSRTVDDYSALSKKELILDERINGHIPHLRVLCGVDRIVPGSLQAHFGNF
jgi:hypothetical protein